MCVIYHLNQSLVFLADLPPSAFIAMYSFIASSTTVVCQSVMSVSSSPSALAAPCPALPCRDYTSMKMKLAVDIATCTFLDTTMSSLRFLVIQQARRTTALAVNRPPAQLLEASRLLQAPLHFSTSMHSKRPWETYFLWRPSCSPQLPHQLLLAWATGDQARGQEAALGTCHSSTLTEADLYRSGPGTQLMHVSGPFFLVLSLGLKTT